MHYTVAQIHIHDTKWVRKYAAEVTAMVERHGGQYLARTSNAELLEGTVERPSIFLIIAWPSRDVAQNFYNSQEYAEHLAARLKGSSGLNWLVPGEDAAGLAKLPSSSIASGLGGR